MRDSTPAERQWVDDRDQHWFASEVKMKCFCHENPLEHLLWMLTALGKPWDLRTYTSKEDADRIEYLAVNQYQHPDQQMDIIEAEIKNKMHYLTAENVMLSAAMCARNSHSRVYTLSVGARDAADRVRSFRSKAPKSHDEQMLDATNAQKDLNRLLLNQLNSFDWAKTHLDLAQHELRVLCALFDKMSGALSLQDLAKDTILEGSMSYLGKTCDRLQERGLIVSDLLHGPKLQVSKGKKSPKKTFYMITHLGIQKMMQYRNYLHEITFFKKQ